MAYIFRPDARVEVDEFTMSYIETALWSSSDELDDSGGSPLDDNYGPEDIAPDTLRAMIKDCAEFQEFNRDLIGEESKRAGHDFWLTRNHHGAGFWDGDWPEKDGQALTDASHAYGSVDLYVGDDGKVWSN